MGRQHTRIDLSYCGACPHVVRLRRTNECRSAVHAFKHDAPPRFVPAWSRAGGHSKAMTGRHRRGEVRRSQILGRPALHPAFGSRVPALGMTSNWWAGGEHALR